MIELYRCITLPDTWPGTPTRDRKLSPFKANWGDTLRRLALELKHVRAKDTTLALDLKLGDIRRDGGVRADARIKDPSVILALTSGANLLSFPCDRFNHWQDNVRAVALSLEALRKVDRYGIQSGRQYVGFKALGAGSSDGPLTIEGFARELAGLAGVDAPSREGLTDEATLTQWLRRAQARHHPDKQGDPDVFARVQWLKRGLGL